MARELAKEIYDRIHLTGEFRLRSGHVSNEYFDKYLFENDPALLREVAEALVQLIPDEIDALAGLELGGVPLATVASQVSSLPTFFVRKAAKEHGTRRLAEGGDVAGKRLVVIEDVVSSGGQVIESCNALRDAGSEIVAVVCVIDRRSADAPDAISEAGLELRALFTLDELRAAATPDARFANPS